MNDVREKFEKEFGVPYDYNRHLWEGYDKGHKSRDEEIRILKNDMDDYAEQVKDSLASAKAYQDEKMRLEKKVEWFRVRHAKALRRQFNLENESEPMVNENEKLEAENKKLRDLLKRYYDSITVCSFMDSEVQEALKGAE